MSEHYRNLEDLVPRRLVLIEGLSGSGKTTTAKSVVASLELSGIEAKAYHESDDDNPIVIGQLLPDIAGTISRYAARSDFLEDWRALATRVKGKDQTIVLESRFIQNAAMFLFLSGSSDELVQHTVKILDCIKDLKPLLIYLRTSNPGAHAQRALDESPPKWVELATGEFARTPWLRERGLNGHEGWVAFFRTWGAQLDRIVDTLEMDVLRLTDPHLDWPLSINRSVDAVLSDPG